MWCVNPVYIQRYCREVEKEEEEELQRGKVKSVAAMVALRRESVAVARWMGSVHGWRAVEGEEGKEGEGGGRKWLWRWNIPSVRACLLTMPLLRGSEDVVYGAGNLRRARDIVSCGGIVSLSALYGMVLHAQYGRYCLIADLFLSHLSSHGIASQIPSPFPSTDHFLYPDQTLPISDTSLPHPPCKAILSPTLLSYPAKIRNTIHTVQYPPSPHRPLRTPSSPPPAHPQAKRCKAVGGEETKRSGQAMI